MFTEKGTVLFLRDFFNYDGPLFTTLNKITDLVWLNILWLICCLPLFTIGASTTALFYVTTHMVNDEGAGVTKTFFREFKRNFKQGTALWLILVLIGAVLFTDLYIIVYELKLPQPFDTVFVCFNYLLLFVYILTVIYVFPLQCKFENKVKHTLKNALILGIGHLPQSIVIGFMYVAMGFLGYLMPEISLPVISLIGMSGVSLAASYMFNSIFKKHITAKEGAEETEEKDPDAWEIPEDMLYETEEVNDVSKEAAVTEEETSLDGVAEELKED